MTVERTIRALAADNQTVIAELTIQDGGQAAAVLVTQDWRTADELDDIATAFTRMAAVVRSYQGGA